MTGYQRVGSMPSGRWISAGCTRVGPRPEESAAACESAPCVRDQHRRGFPGHERGPKLRSARHAAPLLGQITGSGHQIAAALTPHNAPFLEPEPPPVSQPPEKPHHRLKVLAPRHRPDGSCARARPSPAAARLRRRVGCVGHAGRATHELAADRRPAAAALNNSAIACGCHGFLSHGGHAAAGRPFLAAAVSPSLVAITARVSRCCGGCCSAHVISTPFISGICRSRMIASNGWRALAKQGQALETVRRPLRS